jgi:hypothetical protein
MAREEIAMQVEVRRGARPTRAERLRILQRQLENASAYVSAAAHLELEDDADLEDVLVAVDREVRDLLRVVGARRLAG